MLERRALLRLAGVAGGTLGAALLLDACSAPGPAATKSPAGFPLPLDGDPGIRYAGEYLAAGGQYTAAGLGSADVRSTGTASIASEASAAGVLAAVAPLRTVAAAVAAGAPLVVLAASRQRHGYCLLSRTGGTPIPLASGVRGATVGVRTDDDRAILAGWSAATGIAPARVVTVPAADWLTPLRSGAVDAVLGSLVEDFVDARAAGLVPAALSLADTGLLFVDSVVVTTRATLQAHLGRLRDLLRAEVLGWTSAIDDPVLGAQALVTTYGGHLGLSLTRERSAAIAQNALLLTTDVVTNGLLTITNDLAAASVASLARLGITVSASQLFARGPLDEVFAADQSLIHAFTVPLPLTS